MISKDDYDRFYSYVNKVGSLQPDGSRCWEWTGGKSDNGYGLFKLCGKMVSVHRLSYQLNNYTIDKSLQVHHSCDNRPCCNPAHLTQGTQLENMRQMHERNRASKLLGDDHPRAKLTSKQVLEIRSLNTLSGLSCTELSKMFKVSHQMISCIINRKSWKHI